MPAPAANHQLVLELPGLPGNADTGTKTPLAAGERCLACAWGRLLVIPGDHDPIAGVAVGRIVIPVGQTVGIKAVFAGIEIEDIAVLFGQTGVPVITNTCSEGDVRRELELVLHIGAHLVGTVVAVRVPHQEGSGGKAGVLRRKVALRKTAEVLRWKFACASAPVANVQLRKAVVPAHGEAVPAQ